MPSRGKQREHIITWTFGGVLWCFSFSLGSPVRPAASSFMNSNIRRWLRNIIHFIFRIYRRNVGTVRMQQYIPHKRQQQACLYPARGHKHFRSCLFYVANIISYFILMWRPLWFKGHINPPLVLYIRNPVKYVCVHSSSATQLYIPLPILLPVPVTRSRPLDAAFEYISQIFWQYAHVTSTLVVYCLLHAEWEFLSFADIS